MIGIVFGYDDNTDAYEIKCIDGETYYALSHTFKFDVKKGDVVHFDCVETLHHGQYQTLMAGNIIKKDEKNHKLFYVKK